MTAVHSTPCGSTVSSVCDMSALVSLSDWTCSTRHTQKVSLSTFQLIPEPPKLPPFMWVTSILDFTEMTEVLTWSLKGRLGQQLGEYNFSCSNLWTFHDCELLFTVMTTGKCRKIDWQLKVLTVVFHHYFRVVEHLYHCKDRIDPPANVRSICFPFANETLRFFI